MRLTELVFTWRDIMIILDNVRVMESPENINKSGEEIEIEIPIDTGYYGDTYIVLFEDGQVIYSYSSNGMATLEVEV